MSLYGRLEPLDVLAFARPLVLPDTQRSQPRTEHIPHLEAALALKPISMKGEDTKVGGQGLEHLGTYELETVVVQVQLPQRGQLVKLLAVAKSLDGVVLEVEDEEFGEALERLVGDGRDLAAVEVERG